MHANPHRPPRARPGIEGPPGLSPGGPSSSLRGRLHRVADVTEHLAYLAPNEDEGDDCNDDDEGEDECVFGETLALLVPPVVAVEHGSNEGHGRPLPYFMEGNAP